MNTAAAPWNVRDHVPIEQFVIQSHRGAGEQAEENTVASFERAWDLGTYPEADLRTTRDGVIVPFHDGDFSRVVKGADAALATKGVQDLSYEELARLDVGAWKGEEFAGRGVPRVDEVFEAMRGRPERHLYMDIKNVELPPLAASVEAHGVERQVVLASRHPEVVREWKTLAPGSDTLLWMGGSEEDLRARLAGLREAGFAGVTQLQIHVHPNTAADAVEPYKVSRAFLREVGAELRQRGILFQTLPYTPDPGVYAPLLDLGVASFATDHPEKTVKAVRDYYAQKPASTQGAGSPGQRP